MPGRETVSALAWAAPVRRLIAYENPAEFSATKSAIIYPEPYRFGRIDES
jgi:hypothetical protein